MACLCKGDSASTCREVTMDWDLAEIVFLLMCNAVGVPMVMAVDAVVKQTR
jgi:hypothetical protein